MPLIEGEGAEAVFAIAALADCNPFVADRGMWMQRALGPAYIPFGPVWHAEGDAFLADPNAALLRERAESLAARLRSRLVGDVRGSDAEYDAYRGLIFYLLWLRYEDDWYYLSPHALGDTPTTDAAAFYKRFDTDVGHFLDPLPGPPPDVPHLFALGFQMRRAFDHIFRRIYGGSFPAATLRATVWESLFTHSARRYRSVLYEKMRDTPTLITGESGTGKELVARAIALSQYVPFHPASGTFAADPEAGFIPVNLSELPGSLVEAEMFGHARGAYTDAKVERQGCFEICGAHGAVFLDEIGDLDPAVQLKLLRVLQSRQFQRLGENNRRKFEGKIIAATHRDLEVAMVSGRFRSDLYYRICADSIETPSLREQLASCPGDLHNLLSVVAQRIVGPEEAPSVVEEVEEYVHREMGDDYPWAGNMRELEHCVRGVLVHKTYRKRSQARGDAAGLVGLIERGEISAEDLLRRYAKIALANLGSLRRCSEHLRISRNKLRDLVGVEKEET